MAAMIPKTVKKGNNDKPSFARRSSRKRFSEKGSGDNSSKKE